MSQFDQNGHASADRTGQYALPSTCSADSDERVPVRVVILTGDGPRFVLPFLRAKLALVGIVELNKPAESPESFRERLKEAIRRIKLLRYCRLHMHYQAKSIGCSHQHIERGSEEALAECLKALKPDVVVAYKIPILNPGILEIPRFGFINLHPSLLPKYRGGHPILWMAQEYDLEGGVSVHFMAPQADRGDLLAQAAFTITPGASEEEVERQAIQVLGIPLAIRVLRKLGQGEVTTVKQPALSSTPYACRRSHPKIWETIDWDRWPLEHVWHMLRCHPFWKSRLPGLQGWRQWVDWRIGGYKWRLQPGARGEIEARPGGYRLSHRHGWIAIVPVIRPWRLLKLSLLWWLEKPVALIDQYARRD